MSRNNLTENDSLKRINAQEAQSEKIKKADYVIENNSSLSELQSKVNEFVKYLK